MFPLRKDMLGRKLRRFYGMSDEGSDSWEVVEESSSEEEENPEYADARLSADVEAFLASAAAFSQSSTAASLGKADLVQAAADTVEKAAKSEASTTRDKLRRYKTVKKLIRHLKSFLFSTRRPSVFEKCFVESMQANTSASESLGGDLLDGLDRDLRCFPLINGEIQFSTTLTQPEEFSSQVPGQDPESLGASSLLGIHQGKDDALPQAASLSSTASPLPGHTVAAPAAEEETCLLKTTSQEPASQKATLQEATPEDVQPEELVHQEATSASYSGLVEGETPADPWHLSSSPWDSDSIWTYDSSSGSCDSHSEVDESPPTCSSSSSSFQVLSDATEEEAVEAPSPMMVMWLSSRQPEPSQGENPADGPSEAQVLRLTAKLRPPVPDPQPPVLDQAVMAESCHEPLGTETAAGSEVEAAMPAADPGCRAGEQEEAAPVEDEDQELGEGEPQPGHQEDDFRGVPGDQIPQGPGHRGAGGVPGAVPGAVPGGVPREFAAFVQHCCANLEWAVEQLCRALALTPAQARRQLQVMWLVSLLLSMAILTVLTLGVFEVSRQALRYDGKSVQAYKEENRMLVAEIQMLNATIQEMRRQHELEMERCWSAKPGPDQAWETGGAWDQLRDLWEENGGWSFLDQISAPLKKASTYVQRSVSKTLEDIPKMYDDFVKNTFKTGQADEFNNSLDKYWYQIREKLESLGYVFDSDFTSKDLIKYLMQLSGKKSAGTGPSHTGPNEDEGEQSGGRDGATVHTQGKPKPVPEEKPKEESQSKEAEENKDDRQKESRQVKFHAKTGPHRGGDSRKKEKGEKVHRAAMKFIRELKRLDEMGCLRMKPKKVAKVIRRLEQLRQDIKEHPNALVQAELDCQIQWWRPGDQPGIFSIPESCDAIMAEWQLTAITCGKGTKASKKMREQHREGGRPIKKPEMTLVLEDYPCGDQCQDEDWESQMGHQYRASHNQGQSHRGKSHGEEHAGASQQQKSTDAGSQEADTEGKWYEEMMEHRQREHQRKADEKEEWYILRAKARREERKAARASDWFFDRHQRRKWWRNYKNKFWTWVYSYTSSYFR